MGWALWRILWLCGLTWGDELVYVLEYSRHGARYPFLSVVDWNIESMELTAAGMRQHYVLGQMVRKKYIEQIPLLRPQYHPQDITFFSSNLSRCIVSGLSQITGIYPPGTGDSFLGGEEGWPPNSHDYTNWSRELGSKAVSHGLQLVPLISSCEDIMNWEYVCPNIETLFTYDEDIIRTQYHNLYSLLASTYNQTQNLTLKDAASLRDVAICGLVEGRFIRGANYTQQLIHNTSKIYELRKHELYLNLTYKGVKVSQLVAFRFVQRIKQALTQAMKQHSQSVVGRRKMEVFVGSDTLLQALLLVLGHGFQANGCPFASTIFFELYKNVGQEYYIKLIYNNDVSKVYDFTEFIDLLTKQLPPDSLYREFCQPPLSIEGRGYSEWPVLLTMGSLMIVFLAFVLWLIRSVLRKSKPTQPHDETELQVFTVSAPHIEVPSLTTSTSPSPSPN